MTVSSITGCIFNRKPIKFVYASRAIIGRHELKQTSTFFYLEWNTALSAFKYRLMVGQIVTKQKNVSSLEGSNSACRGKYKLGRTYFSLAVLLSLISGRKDLATLSCLASLGQTTATLGPSSLRSRKGKFSRGMKSSSLIVFLTWSHYVTMEEYIFWHS